MGNNNENRWTLYVGEPNFGEEFFKLVGFLDDKFKGNPNAPKDIEGNYTLTVSGRTVTLSDGKDKVEATCYYKDNFDIGEGVRQCLEKLKKERGRIKIGNMVEVVNNTYAHVAYTNFFGQNDCMYYAPFYRYRDRPKNGTKGLVSCIDENGFVLIRAITHGEFQGFYIVKEDGLRKVVK